MTVDREALARYVFTEWRRVHPGTLTWETFGDRHRQPFYEQADVFLDFLASRGGARAEVVDRTPSIDLRGSGLLWLINATVFHPRGFALGVDEESGQFRLLGDGTEMWTFPDDADTQEKFRAAEATLDAHRTPR